MWLLESAKDRILGVDNPGQHVPSRVWYGTSFLLIRNTIGCVSCLVEWRITQYFAWDLHGARGTFVVNLSAASGAFVGKPYQSMTYSCSKPL
jgi:hypothetical protein